MSFLPIVERELRVAARRRGTYWLRLFLVLGVLVIWFALVLSWSASTPIADRSQMLFVSLGVLALAFSRDLRSSRNLSLLIGFFLLLFLGLLAGAQFSKTSTRHVYLIIALPVAFLAHLVFKVSVAIEASRRLSEDRQNGALELLLVTPLLPRNICDGQRLALQRQFRGALLLCLLINASLFGFLLINSMGINGEGLAVFMEITIGGAAVLIVDFHALGWVGMSMALRSRRHHRAVFATLARIMGLPWLGLLFFFVLSIGGGGMNTETLMTLVAVWFAGGIAVDLPLAAASSLQLERMRER